MKTLALHRTMVAALAITVIASFLFSLPEAARAAETASSTQEVQLASCQNAGLSLDGVGNGMLCALQSFLVTILAGVEYVFIGLMQAGAWLFDAAIQQTIVQFGQIYTGDVAQNIEAAWTSIRDLANILIIGFFVFIAISIILGLQEYGQKKLIARVVIVAILINFSFLFTTLVINASNLTAKSIYDSAIAPKVDAGDGSSAKGLASRFEQMLGIATLKSDEYQVISNLNQEFNSGVGALFLHVFTVIVFCTLAAVAFFYAMILLYMRVIVLLLLLVVSAGAFATYLAPSFAESETGWAGWWHALLNNAFFAPLLMLFFAMSVRVAGSIAQNREGSLASVLDKAPQGTSVSAMTSFVIVLGLFVAGVYIASRLASGIASRAASFGTALPLAMTARAAAFPMRQIIGGRSAARAEATGEEMKSKARELAAMAPDDARRKGAEREWMRLSRQKGRQDWLAKSSFDLMNTKPLSKLGAAAGLPGALTKESKASYADDTHKQVKAAVEEATKAAISSQDATNVARKEKGEDESGRTTVERERDAADTNLRAAQKTADAAKALENLPEKMAQAQRDLSVTRNEVTQEKVRVSENPELSARDKQIQRMALDNRIKEAQEKVNLIQSRIEYHNDTNTAEFKKRLADAKEAVQQEQDEIKEAARTYQRQSSLSAQNIAAQSVGSWYTRALRRNGIDLDSHVSHEARAETRKRTQGPRMDRAALKKADKEDAGDDHGHAPAAPASGGSAAGGAHHA